MAAWAVLHFNIALQMTRIALGTKTVLHNRKTLGIHSCASLLSARRSYCQSFSALAGQYMFFEPVISGDWQSCRTVLDLWASNCRGLIVLQTVIFLGLLYSAALAVLRTSNFRGLSSCRTVLVLWASNFQGLTVLRTLFCQGLPVL